MKKSLFLLCAFLGMAMTTFAGGFQVNVQGQKQNGMAHCGAGLMIDASSVFFNPGAMSLQDRSSFSVGVSPILGRFNYQEAAPGTYTTANVPGVSTPFYAYFNYRFKGSLENLSVGIGINTPFGSALEYEEDWKYAALIQKISLLTVYTQPTVSWKFSDKLGIGAGLVIGYGDVALSKAVPVQDQNGEYGQGNISGSDFGFGANAGIYFTPNDQLSIGLNYRSAVRFVAEGDAEFIVAPSLVEFFPTTTFAADLTLPQNITLGVGYQLNDKLRLAADLQFVGWSSYDSLNFIFADTTDKLKYQYNTRLWKDTFIFRLGAEYAINDALTLRGGVSYDMTPVPDGRLIPDTPDSDKLSISTGASYTIANKLDLDASFILVEGLKRSGENIDHGYAGTYKARAFVPGFGLTYYFGGNDGTPTEFVDPTFE